MRDSYRKTFAAVVIGLAASSAAAGPCDYRPSQLIGGAGASAIGTAAAGTSGLGLAISSAGFYTLTHAVTGATMLGSTLGGASAAGTVGIMGGTAGLLGGIVAVITAPATIIGGAVIAGGIGVIEGACYFTDERITDVSEVYALMATIGVDANPEVFQLNGAITSPSEAHIRVRVGVDEYREYQVGRLYIVNGMLKYQKWGVNETIGNVYQLQ